MPNPEFEGIARQIQASLAKAGGQALADKVYKAKVADGSAQLTHIHHRQTPLWLMQGKAQAGVTWQAEVRFQEQEIGRASCRERVCQYVYISVVAGSFKKKTNTLQYD